MKRRLSTLLWMVPWLGTIWLLSDAWWRVLLVSIGVGLSISLARSFQ